jgi:hypothetical protein
MKHFNLFHFLIFFFVSSILLVVVSLTNQKNDMINRDCSIFNSNESIYLVGLSRKDYSDRSFPAYKIFAKNETAIVTLPLSFTSRNNFGNICSLHGGILFDEYYICTTVSGFWADSIQQPLFFKKDGMIFKNENRFIINVCDPDFDIKRK